MKLIAIPLLIIFGITIYVALLFFIHYLYTRERENILFSLTCLTWAIYDLLELGLYHSQSMLDGLYFQRLQFIILNFLNIFYLWFIVEFSEYKNKLFRNIFTVIHASVIFFILFFPARFLFNVSEVNLRTLNIYNFYTFSYYEAIPLPSLIILMSISLLSFLYTIYILIKLPESLIEKKERYYNRKLLLIVVLVFSFIVINDILVVLNIYHSIYLIEFGFLLVIVFMSFLLSINHSYTKLKLKRSIIDQKIAIDRLEKSELRLKNIIENANELIFTISQNLIITYISPAWNNLLNYSISDTIGKSIFNFIHPDDKIIFKSIFEKNISERNIEYRILHSNGSWIWHRATCTPVFNNNDILYYVILSQDIMENRQTLEALRFSEERLHNIIDNANDIIFTMSPHGMFFFVSPVWEKALGHKVSDVEGSAIFKYIHKDDIESVKNYLNNILASETDKTDIEYRIIHINGSWRWHRSTLSIVRDTAGDIEYLVGINQDITQNKISEKKLSESEQRLDMALNGADLGLWDWNFKTGKVVFNKNPEDFFGIDIDLSNFNDQKLMEFINPDDLEVGLKNIDEHLMGKTPNFESEYRVNLQQNKFVWILVKGKLFERDGEGNPLRAVGTFMDITRTKNAAQELRNSLREKEILLREIHHRVKNNFQIIISLLNLQSSDMHDKKLLEFFNVYHSRIRSMALIHEKMYHSTELNAIDFSDYALSIVNEISSMYIEDDFDIEIKSDLETVFLDIDEAIPSGLILNEIVTNIFKYAFPPEYPVKPCINLKIKKSPDGFIEMYIADNGIGLKEKLDLDKIDTLGLKLIYMLTENQLRGSVSLDRNNGTGFTIKFPIKKTVN